MGISIRPAGVVAAVAMIATLGWAGNAMASSTTLPEPAYQWPEAHQNPQVTGNSSDPAINQSNAASLGISWMTYTGNEILGSPVVAWSSALDETLVYVGNDGGYFTAYDQADGLPVWSVNLGSAIRSTPLVEGGYVWIAPTQGGRAFKLNAATGATVCSAPIANANGETVDASPVIATPPGHSSTIYFGENDSGSTNGPITALDEATCAVDFQSSPEPKAGVGGVWDMLSYGVDSNGEGLVFFGTADPDSAVYAIDAVTGTLAWRFQTENPDPYSFDVGAGVTVSPPGNNGFADGIVYAVNKYGILYALDMDTGAVIWQDQFGSGSGTLGTPALSGNALVLGGSDGTVYQFNATTGGLNWSTPLGQYNSIDGAPAVVGPAGNQVVFVSDLTGQYTALSMSSGVILDELESGTFSTSSPAEVDGNLIVTSGNGFVYDLAPGAGGEAAPTTSVSSPSSQSTIAYPGPSVPVEGTATGTTAIGGVDVYIQRSGAGGTWWDSVSRTWTTSPYPNQATLSSPDTTSTSWSTSLPVPPAGGSFEAYASAVSGSVADPSIGSSQSGTSRSAFTVAASSTASRLIATVPWAGPGGAVALQGSGFAPGEAVAISLDGTTLKTVKAGTKGVIAPTTVLLPIKTPFGPADLDATGATSGDLGVAPIYVTNSWSQFGYGPTHDATDPNDSVLGVHLSLSPQTFLNQAWSFDSGAPVSGSVSVGDGYAYFANTAGTVYSIKMSTGLPQWSYSLPGSPIVSSAPALTKTALVLVASQDGNLTALRQFTGTVAWVADVGGKIEDSPTVVGGVAFIGSDDGVLTAVNLKTGSVLWTADLGSAISGTPAVDPATGLVIASTNTGTVTALGMTTGNESWQTTVGGPITAAVVIANGHAYIGSEDDTLYALSESNGSPVWTYNAAGPIGSAVTVDANQLVVGSGDGYIHYLDTSTGTPQYAINVGSPLSGEAGSRDFVASLGTSGLVLGSKPTATNPRAWVTSQGTALSAAPTVVNGEVIVPGNDGMVDVYTVPGLPAY